MKVIWQLCIEGEGKDQDEALETASQNFWMEMTGLEGKDLVCGKMQLKMREYVNLT